MTPDLEPETLPALPATPGVSFIMPVLNEAEHLAAAVDTILAQDYAGPKEVVLALGPSTDDTTGIAERLAAADERIRLVHNPAGDTPTSLNLAVAATSHPIIIRVDAHSELTADYTATGIAVLRETGVANCGGLMVARGRTALQKAVARAYMSRIGLGGPAYHAGDEAQDAESAYLGIYRREVFDRLGGFDTTLRRGQDWELNLRIREAGGRVRFDPRLQVTYWPRAEYRKVVQQFYATGTWRAEIVRRYGAKNSPRYFAPPLLVLGTAAAAACAVAEASGTMRRAPAPVRVLGRAAFAPVAAYAAGILGVAATARDCAPGERAWFAAIVPTMHLSWGAGFLRGTVTGAKQTVDRSRA